MRLELGKIFIKDVQFADKTHVKDGVLYVNKEELEALVLEDERLIKAAIELARPGESIRITPVIERAGIPVVHIATITPISLTIGANRIVPGMRTPHPLGDSKQSAEKQYELRKNLVQCALKALQTPVTGQIIFEN